MDFVLGALLFCGGALVAWFTPYRIHREPLPPVVALSPSVRLPGRVTLARIRPDVSGWGRICYCPEYRWKQWRDGAVIDGKEPA